MGAVFVVPDLTDHDHVRAEGQLGMHDRAGIVLDDEMRPEPETLLEELEGSVGIVITQAGDDR